MKFDYSIDRLLQIVGEGAECVGHYEGSVLGIASLSEAQAGIFRFSETPNTAKMSN